MAGEFLAGSKNNKVGMLSAFAAPNPISFRNDGKVADSITSESIPVSSTAIQNARYDPEDNSLNITYKGGGKEYKFDAKDDLQEWVDAPSKGRITQEWRTSHRAAGY